MSRWHDLRAAVKASNLTAADKAVFLARVDHSTYGTADMPARWTRSQKTVARETSLSRRQVQYSEAHLERHGWLKAAGTTGPGKTRGYTFAAGRRCDCTGRRHEPQRAQPKRPTGATTAPERAQPTGATPQANGHIALQDVQGKGFERGSLSQAPGQCPLCGDAHERCEFAAGSLRCIRPECGNPHHRESAGAR